MNITLVDHQDEELAARAARNCYGGWTENDRLSAGTGDIDEVLGNQTLEDLFEHLLDCGHFGPFEEVSLNFEMEGVSRVTMSQITRHRPGVSFDIQSFRYTAPDHDEIMAIWIGDEPLDSIDEYVVIPKLARTLDQEDKYRRRYLRDFIDYVELAEDAEEAGMPESRIKEDCRYQLPKGLKCTIMMSVNLRSLMHIADMRAAGDAQWEAREMTEEILRLASEACPVSMGIYDRELKGRKNRLSP